MNETTIEPGLHRSLYKAFVAHDHRFDGKYFVGVTSTRIYCRPVCRVRTPKESNCRFYRSAALAELDSFRPCLRCRPELAPGVASVDDSNRVARAALKRIQAGALNSGDLNRLADEFALGERQLRRIIERTFGATPVQLAQTHRLLLAKRLLTETRLSVRDVASAAGFGSARRLNVLLKDRYRLTPTDIRGDTDTEAITKKDSIEVVLAFRPPLAWDHLLNFLAGRVIAGVEARTERGYARTVKIGDRSGWIEVFFKDAHHLGVCISNSLIAELPQILTSVRDVFDLEAEPTQIDSHLSESGLLKKIIASGPGVRVPGAFDAFEIGLRTILGQQVSVSAATTISGRFASRFGEPLPTPIEGLSALTPTAARVASLSLAEVRECGLPAARAQCVLDLARAFADNRLRNTPATDPAEVMALLQTIKGIGPWTANYFVMRTMHWPDAFPESDLGILKALKTKSGSDAASRAEAWRPWRAYATMYLWKGLSTEVNAK